MNAHVPADRLKGLLPRAPRLWLLVPPEVDRPVLEEHQCLPCGCLISWWLYEVGGPGSRWPRWVEATLHAPRCDVPRRRVEVDAC